MSTYVVAHLPTQPTAVHARVLSVHRSYAEATAWIDGRLTLDPMRADPPAVWEWISDERWSLSRTVQFDDLRLVTTGPLPTPTPVDEAHLTAAEHLAREVQPLLVRELKPLGLRSRTWVTMRIRDLGFGDNEAVMTITRMLREGSLVETTIGDMRFYACDAKTLALTVAHELGHAMKIAEAKIAESVWRAWVVGDAAGSQPVDTLTTGSQLADTLAAAFGEVLPGGATAVQQHPRQRAVQVCPSVVAVRVRRATGAISTLTAVLKAHCAYHMFNLSMCDANDVRMQQAMALTPPVVVADMRGCSSDTLCAFVELLGSVRAEQCVVLIMEDAR